MHISKHSIYILFTIFRFGEIFRFRGEPQLEQLPGGLIDEAGCLVLYAGPIQQVLGLPLQQLHRHAAQEGDACIR
jgi:hypothetical protein